MSEKGGAVYFWLKKDVTEEQLNALEEKQEVKFNVQTDRASGRKYIDIQTIDIGDVTAEVSKELEELIEKVTARDRVPPMYAEGIYLHGNTTLVARNEGNRELLVISGPNLKAVNAIYSLLRQKKLAPEENWGV